MTVKDPRIASVLSLHGLHLSQLTDSQYDTLSFFIERGRKYGVTVSVEGLAPIELRYARKEAKRRAGGRISVTYTPPKKGSARLASAIDGASHAPLLNYESASLRTGRID